MGQIKRFGYRKDRNDRRDYTHEDVKIQLPEVRDTKIDNRKYCSTVKDQGNLGSCTANAYCSMYEFLNKKHRGAFVPLSRLFVYKMTRYLMGEEGAGDSGAYIRTTVKAGVIYGAPPEEYWAYSDREEVFDREPHFGTFGMAAQYQPLTYFRLDKSEDYMKNLQNIKAYVAAGYPIQFGFNVYQSYTEAEETGNIPYPEEGEAMVGGHSVMIAGYDDNRKIGNKTGALLIQNSWGTGWGDRGFGYLPYQYILDWLADDFWTVIRSEFMDTKRFD